MVANLNPDKRRSIEDLRDMITCMVMTHNTSCLVGSQRGGGTCTGDTKSTRGHTPECRRIRNIADATMLALQWASGESIPNYDELLQTFREERDKLNSEGKEGKGG